MTQDKKFVDMIVEGLQDGKASKIVVVDLTGIENCICLVNFHFANLFYCL